MKAVETYDLVKT